MATRDFDRNPTPDELRSVDDIKRVLANSRASRSTRHREIGAACARFRRMHARGRLPRLLAGMLEAINGWFWEPAQAGYAAQLEALEEFARRHGLAAITGGTVHGGLAIGQWLMAQRSRYRRGKASPWLKRRLEALPGWSVRRRTETEKHAPRTSRIASRHIETLERLTAMASQRGAPGRDSRRLTYVRRYFRRLVERNELPGEIRPRLEALPGWKKVDRLASDRACLAAFRRASRSGRLAPAAEKIRIGDVTLGTWFVRCKVRRRQGRLAPWLQRQLERIPGFRWPESRAFAARRKLDLLRRFLERHPLAMLRRTPLHDGVDLYRWVLGLRRRHHDGRHVALAKDLERIPGWSWEAPVRRRARRLGWKGDRGDRRAALDKGYTELIAEYFRHTGRSSFERKPVCRGFDLREAVSSFRRRYRDGTLTPATIGALESIPAWRWNPVEERFRRNLALVSGFAREHGLDALHCGVVLDGEPIGKWFALQRSQYQSGQLHRRWRADLERLRGWKAYKGHEPYRSLRRAATLARHLEEARAWSRRRAGGQPRESLLHYFRTEQRAGRLPPKVREEIRALGLQLERKLGKRQRRLQLLRRLAAKGGLPQITTDTVVDGEPVGRWAMHCCKRYREQRLEPWLVAGLEAIPGWVWPPTRWEVRERKLALLIRFLEERDYEDLVHHPRHSGVNLHTFVLGLRKSYNRDKLPDDVIRICETLPGWSWHPLQDRGPTRPSASGRGEPPPLSPARRRRTEEARAKAAASIRRASPSRPPSRGSTATKSTDSK